MKRSKTGELFQEFTSAAIESGNLPIPLLSMIHNGILNIPHSLIINEGLASAISTSMKNLEAFGVKGGLKKAIFDKNSMNDSNFGKILSGLLCRKELNSLTSICNEIGIESANLISQMLEPKKSKVQEPELQELCLKSNKITSDATDIIFEALSYSMSLRYLSLQNLKCSN